MIIAARNKGVDRVKVFISGGCKNGKSYYAQRLAAKQWNALSASPLYYIATMKPADAEDDLRIARHKTDREGWGFITVEQPARIEGILEKCDSGGSFLLDSLTALLANEMFPPGGGVNERAAENIERGLACILDVIGDIVIVSDYIYSDAIIYDPLTELFRKSLAGLDRAAAKACDAVVEVTYSAVVMHKGDRSLSGSGWRSYEKCH